MVMRYFNHIQPERQPRRDEHVVYGGQLVRRVHLIVVVLVPESRVPKISKK